MEPIAALILANVAYQLFRSWQKPSQKVINFIKRPFDNRNVLILGAQGSGKTSLLNYLSSGKPYIEDLHGNRIAPSPTANIAIINEHIDDAANIEKLNWVQRLLQAPNEKLLRDVAGELVTSENEVEKQKLLSIFKEIDPHGIIYLIDGRKSGPALKHAVDEAFEYVLARYCAEQRRLRAFHLFVGFCDQMNFDERANKLGEVTTLFSLRSRVPTYKWLSQINVSMALTHLNIEANYWQETDTAINQFRKHMELDKIPPHGA
ncbi:MAG: hypothetical protein KIH69_003195 [Anaerolineae bacterium]|nr:hypothetical protein [Anaerolineae bacterium]